MRKTLKNNLKVVDLFAGIGGLSLGFQQAGFNVVGAFDNWEPAIQVYKDNFIDHKIYNLNLSNVEESVKAISKLNPDIIIGGPPCQDFSHAGKRDESKGRADLTVAYAKIVAKIRPKYFLMENVDQITKSKILPQALEILQEAGYGITQRVIDASYCGAPQKRKRFFMIGVLGGNNYSVGYYLEKNLSKTPMTVREYFGKDLDVEYYYRHPRNYNRRAVYSIDEPSATIRGVNRPIPKGYKVHSNDPVKNLKEVRPLTTAERARIQTFPKTFKIAGPKTHVEQMLGNAVPVTLAKYVAGCLAEYIEKGENPDYKPAPVQLSLLTTVMA